MDNVKLLDDIKKILKEQGCINERDDWKKKKEKTTKINGVNIKCRKNIVTKDNGKEYKYIEYTKLNDNDKIFVGIGYNPAKSNPNKIDITNKKVINALKEYDCGEYILLNLYPQVTKTEKELKSSIKTDEKVRNFPSILCKILDKIKEKYSNVNLLIFWGRTVPIPNDIYDTILKFLDSHLHMTINTKKENKHYHPAHVSERDLKIKQVKENSFKELRFLNE